MDEKHVLVDQPVVHERPDELTAAENDEIASRLLLERSHGPRGLAGRRRELLHGSGSSSVLEATYFRLLFSTSVKDCPFAAAEAVEVLIRASTEQQSGLRGHALLGDAGDDWIPERRPAAVLEAAPTVLVGAARRLHHAVERQMLEDDDFFLIGSPPRPLSRRRTPNAQQSSCMARDSCRLAWVEGEAIALLILEHRPSAPALDPRLGHCLRPEPHSTILVFHLDNDLAQSLITVRLPRSPTG